MVLLDGVDVLARAGVIINTHVREQMMRCVTVCDIGCKCGRLFGGVCTEGGEVFISAVNTRCD